MECLFYYERENEGMFDFGVEWKRGIQWMIEWIVGQRENNLEEY